jgi:exodeoxyribonuclease VII large subunit
MKSFNDELIARSIFSSKIPVIVGVGHEKDESIADFASDIRASTPSQAAYYITSQNQAFLENNNNKLETIHQIMQNRCNELFDQLQYQVSNIESCIFEKFDSQKNKIEALIRILKPYNVSDVLRRGYALIEKNDKSIHSIKNIKPKDQIKTRLFDGKFISTVNTINS